MHLFWGSEQCLSVCPARMAQRGFEAGKGKLVRGDWRVQNKVMGRERVTVSECGAVCTRDVGFRMSLVID